MISGKTTFILGAGAHKPWGFPIMSELKALIIRDFSGQYYNYLNFISDSKIFRDNKRHLIEENFVKNYEISPVCSIDRFLRENPKFSNDGKMAIIFNLLAKENLFISEYSKKELNDNWFNYLFNIMIDFSENPTDILKNDVAFITFNYDRTLEYLFLQSLRCTYTDLYYEKVVDIYKKIPIYHVYGKLGNLKEDNANVQEPFLVYGEMFNAVYHRIEELSKNIMLIQERKSNNYDSILKRISESNNIYFLGFSYDIANMEILGFPEILNEQNIYGTALSQTKHEISKIKARLSKHSRYDIIQDLESLQLLRNHLVTD